MLQVAASGGVVHQVRIHTGARCRTGGIDHAHGWPPELVSAARHTDGPYPGARPRADAAAIATAPST